MSLGVSDSECGCSGSVCGGIGRSRLVQIPGCGAIRTTKKTFSPALEDLLGTQNPSVFIVNDDHETKYAAQLFTLTHLAPDINRYFICIPASCLRGIDGVEYSRVDDPDLHPFLAERHHELTGLDDLDRRYRLARAILSCTRFSEAPPARQGIAVGGSAARSGSRTPQETTA